MPATNTAQHKNEVHLAGILAEDPVIRVTANGKKVANVTLTTTHKGKSEYHRIVLWEELANRIEGLRKNEFIKIVGHLQTRSYEKDGTKHFVTEVNAWNLGVPSRDLVTTSTSGAGITDEDIPF
jgi:single-strand DNA-binding protein